MLALLAVVLRDRCYRILAMRCSTRYSDEFLGTLLIGSSVATLFMRSSVATQPRGSPHKRMGERMQRRTLIQTVLTWIGLSGQRMGAQSSAFPGKHEATLKELAATVLPESLGRAGTDTVAAHFVRWVKEYRAGAEMQTGYGFTRVRYKPSSPESRYLEQLDQLASGALTEPDVIARRTKIAAALKAANVKDLATFPDGAHIVSDLMTFYFQSSEANDRAYEAKVGKDQCRGLRNSGAIPAALRQEVSSDKV